MAMTREQITQKVQVYMQTFWDHEKTVLENAKRIQKIAKADHNETLRKFSKSEVAFDEFQDMISVLFTVQNECRAIKRDAKVA